MGWITGGSAVMLPFAPASPRRRSRSSPSTTRSPNPTRRSFSRCRPMRTTLSVRPVPPPLRSTATSSAWQSLDRADATFVSLLFESCGEGYYSVLLGSFFDRPLPTHHNTRSSSGDETEWRANRTLSIRGRQGRVSIYACPLRGRNSTNRIVTKSQKTEAGETKKPFVCARSYGAAARLTHAAKMGNDSRRGLMTESNKTVTIPYLPVGWSPPNPFCPKGAVRRVAHTFAAQFMVRFQATKQQRRYEPSLRRGRTGQSLVRPPSTVHQLTPQPDKL